MNSAGVGLVSFQQSALPRSINAVSRWRQSDKERRQRGREKQGPIMREEIGLAKREASEGAEIAPQSW